MRNHLAATTALLLAGQVSAQGAPTFVPKSGALFTVRVDDVPGLLAALPSTRLGKLLALPEVAAAWATGTERVLSRRSRLSQLLHAAIARKVRLEPWLASQCAGALLDTAFDAFDADDLRSAMLVVLPRPPDAANPYADTSDLTLVRCAPRVEGKATRRFEAIATALADSGWVRRVADAKLDGLPAHAFAPVVDDDSQPWLRANGVWMVHLPGTFAGGTGTPAECGTVGTTAAAAATVSLDVDLVAAMGMQRGVVPPEFAQLGFDTLQSLRWQAAIEGEVLRDDLTLAFAAAPGGLLGSLLTGTATLPAQALPDGALAQLRIAVDMPQLLDIAVNLANGEIPLTEARRAAIANVLTGGVALGIAAPARGGVVPRLFVSLGLRDEAAARALLGTLLGADHSKDVEYDGHILHVVTADGLLAALQPTLCIRAGVLHATESVASMRALLQALQGGAEAMALRDEPAAVAGETALPGFDLRFDAAAIYDTFHTAWLPLFELTMQGDRDLLTRLLARDDLPRPDSVAALLGCGRGVLVRDGSSWVLRQRGALGGLVLSALAMTWGPIVSVIADRDHVPRALEKALGEHLLQSVWPALRSFHAAQGRWPKDLAELFAASKLAPDALLLPGDDMAEPFALPDGGTGRSSFRLFPTTVSLTRGNGHVEALLVQIRPHPYQRLLLTEDGESPDMGGKDNNAPVDQLGK